MARFLKIHASHESHRLEERGLQTRYLNVYTIDEISQGTRRRQLDANGRGVNDEHGQPVYIETTALRVALPFYHHANSGVVLDHAEYTVDGKPSEWVKRIEQMIADDRPQETSKPAAENTPGGQ